LFLTKSQQFVIHELKIMMSPDGEVTGTLTMRLAYNRVPPWSRSALAHLRASRDANGRLLAAHAAHDKDAKGDACAVQCIAGMEAAAAAWTAIDALYGALKVVANLPTPSPSSSERKKTARYKQIAELFKNVFQLPQNEFNTLRDALEKLSDYRDPVAHPTGDFQDPLMYPGLGEVMERRFVLYRFENARAAANSCLSIVWQLLHIPLRQGREGATDFVRATKELLHPILSQWEAEFGPMLPPAPTANPPA
jgi:hypothetical protein